MAESSRRFRDDPVLVGAAVFYCVLWVVTAIAPFDRKTWLLENSIVVVFAVLIVGGFRRWRFTTASYVTMTIFFTLHAFGAHSTYAGFPPGLWVQDLLSLERNPYDRFVHFASGVLMAEPCRELLLHYVRVSRRWARLLAVPFVVAAGAVFEVFESWAMRLIGAASEGFMATQGDVWDAQKDITVCAVGALLWLGFRTYVRPDPLEATERDGS